LRYFPQVSDFFCPRASEESSNIAGSFSRLRISLPNIAIGSRGWPGWPKPNCSISVHSAGAQLGRSDQAKILPLPLPTHRAPDDLEIFPHPWAL